MVEASLVRCSTCLENDSACVWTGKLGNLESHLKECLFVLCACRNASRGCSEIITRGSLNNHIQDCPYELQACPNKPSCGRSVQRRYLRTHVENECECRVVACPNNCGNSLPANQMDSHITTFCLFQKVCSSLFFAVYNIFFYDKSLLGGMSFYTAGMCA